MKNSAGKFVRVFGLLHAVYAVAGLTFALDSLHRYSRRPIRTDELYFEPHAFYVSVVLNLFFISLLAISGIFLWRMDRRGVRLSNWLFSLEVIYWVAGAGLTLLLSLSHKPVMNVLGKSIAAVEGIGNMGIAPQILTGYPIIALVALNLLNRKLSRSEVPANSTNS